MNAIYQSHLPYLKLLFRGKVRDIYDLGDELLLVATDRLSAFDVVFPNHISDKPVEDVFRSKEDVATYAKRSMRVKKTKPLAIEAVIRGYLAGSGWNDYQKTGKVCGISLPSGLKESQKLPEPIFTPAT